MEKTPQELFKEREKRVLDAIHLKVPDRVPVISIGGFFAAKYAGFTFKEAMYDRDKAVEATLRYLQDFQPDTGENPFMFTLMGSSWSPSAITVSRGRGMVWMTCPHTSSWRRS